VCVTEAFTGEVLSCDMFRQEIVLVLPDGTQEAIHLSQIREIQGRRAKGPANPAFPGPGRPDSGRGTSGRFRAGEGTRQSGRFGRSGPQPQQQQPQSPDA
jgi:hypothetical protein